MSSAILNAQASSAVVSTINSSGGLKVPFIYNESDRLVPPHAIQLLNVPADSGTPAANKSTTFSIPKNGFMTGIWINAEFPDLNVTNTSDTATEGQTEDVSGALTLDTTDTVGVHPLGYYRMIKEARLETSGRIIESLDTFSILSRLSDMPYGKRRAIEKAADMAGDPADYTNKYRRTLWLPFYFNGTNSVPDPRYAYNTLFNEPLRLVVTLNSCKTICKTSSATDFTAHVPTDMELLCRYAILDDKSTDAVVQANQGDGMLSQLISVMRSESTAVVTGGSSAGGTTDCTIDLKNNEAVEAIYFAVTQEDATPGFNSYKTALKVQAPLEVTNVELKFNNASILSCPGHWVQFHGRVGGEGDGTDAAQSSGMQYLYKIDFSLLSGWGTTNVIAMRELAQPQLLLTFKHNGTSKTHHVHVRYSTKAFLTTNSNSGRVSLSISS
jgi:hypothetical protein